jgi:hypothetical protein
VERFRRNLVDLVGLLALVALLLDYFRPALLLLPTIAAGGDTPCHYPTAVWFHKVLLPAGRLHGWYPGAYLGQPLLLYYFPLPFLVISALAPFLGLPVAFKLGSVLPVFLLPFAAWACLRLQRFPFPAPLLGAAAATVFLFVEENPIWGGTIASVESGEFAYQWGLCLALLFLGLCFRAEQRGRGLRLAAVALALTALAHGYAVLWAGLSASYLLYPARRPFRALGRLVAVAVLGFALAAISLLPLLADWGWTTPYDDPWITVTLRGLLPPLLWPLAGAAVLGLVWIMVGAFRGDGFDHRLGFLLHAALVAATLAWAAPAFGVIDVRLVPFAQLAVALAGGACLGLGLARARAKGLLALALVGAAVVYLDSSSRVLRPWIDWDYTGLQAKDLWPSFREVADRLSGTVSDPRVAVEYSTVHERVGSIRIFETLPLFAGRSTLEGVYNQASLQTHFVYYLSSLLGATAPNPFKSLEYGKFDPEQALARLRLFQVSEVVAVSAQLRSALRSRSDVVDKGQVGPYTLFRLGDAGAYVEPFRYAPVRAGERGWRQKAWRWFTRQPLSPAFLVFSDDPRFTVAERDEWLAPPEVPLAGDATVHSTVEAERILISTSRPGHPLLIKVSWHPRWRAYGADGPWRVSPALMMVIPRGEQVRLEYATTAWDQLGRWLSLTALAAIGVGAMPFRWRRQRPLDGASLSAAEPAEPRDPTEMGLGKNTGLAALLPRLVRLIPCTLLVLLAASRLGPGPRRGEVPVEALRGRALAALDAGRNQDAAEYARSALTGAKDASLRAELLRVRGEGLLLCGQAPLALEALEDSLTAQPDGPDTPRTLLALVRAHEALGHGAGAAAARRRLGLKPLAAVPGSSRRPGE